jgi:hypothetical protein
MQVVGSIHTKEESNTVEVFSLENVFIGGTDLSRSGQSYRISHGIHL